MARVRTAAAVRVLQTEGPQAFSFLVDEHGFTGPTLGEWTIDYQRGDVEIVVMIFDGMHETSFVTQVIGTFDDLTARCNLHALYATCGFGPAEDVPDDTIGGVRTVRQRIVQHSEALHKLMPQLTGPWYAQLLRRCNRQ